MKRTYFLLFLFCLAAAVHAQRAIPPVNKITDFRPVGETRIWTFEQRDSVVGRLSSTIKESDDINDSAAIANLQTISLDYAKIGQIFQMTSSGERFLSEHGTYLGDDLTLTVNGELGQLKLERNGTEVSGFFTRGGAKQAVTVSVGVNQKALDNSYYDQIEMYLALHGVRVGDTVIDTLFAPEIQLPTVLSYQVLTFRYQRLYNQVAESAFVVQLTEPEQGTLYFTPDRRLVKVEVPDLHRRVYLDKISGSVAKKETPASQVPTKPQIPTSMLILATLPHALTYAVFAFIALLFFAFRQLKKGMVWFAVLWGMVAFIPVNYLQTPVQNWIIETLFIPHIKKGDLLFFWAALPALGVGLIQEVVKFGVLNLFVTVYKPRAYLAPIIGAALGAGFGLVEAVMTTASLGVMPLFGLHLIERGFLILFHTTAGALVGLGLARGQKQLFTALAITVLINSLLRYLPVFAQAKLADITLLYIIFGFIVIGFLAFTWLQLRQSPKELPAKGKQATQ